MENPSVNLGRVLFIGADQELRYPYDRFLNINSLSSNWIKDFEELGNLEIEPLVVVVDIDSLTKPIETHLEKLRYFFPNSDLIALSGVDSAATALLVIRAGFSDFLLKPVSPEELIWSIKKSLQKREVFQKLHEPGTQIVRALTQISSASTPSLVQLTTLDCLREYFQAEGAAWLNLQDTPLIPRFLTPKNVDLDSALGQLKKTIGAKAPPPVSVFVSGEKQSILFSTSKNKEAVLVLGVKAVLSEQILVDDSIVIGKTLLEHAELSLLNLEKFEEIKQVTFIDELTGLYNSRYLKYSLANCIQKSKQSKKPFSVLFIDVDHFKVVNTSHGHLVGSDFLVAIGKSIKNTVRDSDPVFRYGGDEFIVILPDLEEEGAQLIAERIRKGIERRVFSIRGEKLKATVSIGLALYPRHAKDQDTLIKLADLAMYSAKERSRNTVFIHEPELFRETTQKAS